MRVARSSRNYLNPATTQQLQNYERIKNGPNARSILIPRFGVRPNEELSDIKALNNSRNILEISLPRQIKYSSIGFSKHWQQNYHHFCRLNVQNMTRKQRKRNEKQPLNWIIAKRGAGMSVMNLPKGYWFSLTRHNGGWLTSKHRRGSRLILIYLIKIHLRWKLSAENMFGKIRIFLNRDSCIDLFSRVWKCARIQARNY